MGKELLNINKELLLQDLCSRLPYKVKASYHGAEEECECWDEVEGIVNDYVEIGQYSLPIEAVKPYLFPLSSMTEEQKEELYIVTNGKFNAGYKYIDNCKPRNWSEWGTTEYNWIRHYDIDLLHTWLNKNHFDYRGLIEKSLALDATGLNIY